MDFAEFVKYLAGPAALGAVSTVVMQIVKKFYPTVKDDIAFFVSIFVACAVGVMAHFLVPHLDKIPPEIGSLFFVAVWAASQVWNRIRKVVEARFPVVPPTP